MWNKQMRDLMDAAEENNWQVDLDDCILVEGATETLSIQCSRNHGSGVSSLCIAFAKSDDTGRWQALLADDTSFKVMGAYCGSVHSPVVKRFWSKASDMQWLLSNPSKFDRYVDRWIEEGLE